jgi:hypothetical protein
LLHKKNNKRNKSSKLRKKEVKLLFNWLILSGNGKGQEGSSYGKNVYELKNATSEQRR